MDWITRTEYEQLAEDLDSKGLEYVIKDEEKHRKHMRFSKRMSAIFTSLAFLVMTALMMFLLFMGIKYLFGLVW